MTPDGRAEQHRRELARERTRRWRLRQAAGRRGFDCDLEVEQEFRGACWKWREQDSQRHAVADAPSRDELQRMETELDALRARRTAATARLKEELQPWRTAYWRAMESEIAPARAGLHDLATELDAGLRNGWPK